MRTPSISSVFYSPDQLPQNSADLGMFVTSEFQKISVVIRLLAEGHLDKTYAAPLKPREGNIRLADGSSWNPGSGQGVYCYYNSAWRFLG